MQVPMQLAHQISIHVILVVLIVWLPRVLVVPIQAVDKSVA